MTQKSSLRGLRAPRKVLHFAAAATRWRPVSRSTCPEAETSNIGALIIRIGFGGILY